MKLLFSIFYGLMSLTTSISFADISFDAFQMILDHQEECVQQFTQDKIYINPGSLEEKNLCLSLNLSDGNNIFLSYINEDADGYFILCRGYYYWQCNNCPRAYSNLSPPPKCYNCHGTSFTKVYP